MNRFALAALLARQPAANLAPVLKHIQMSPHQLLGVVIAVDQAPLLGASFALPEPVRLPNLQDNGRCFVVVPTLRDFPIQAQSQQFLKHSFRCHAPILNGYSTQNSEEPNYAPFVSTTSRRAIPLLPLPIGWGEGGVRGRPFSVRWY